MFKRIMLFPLMILLGGCCFNNAKMRILDTSKKPTEKVLSYEGSGPHYQELRMALMEYGIKVLKYNVIEGAFLDEVYRETIYSVC